MAIGEFLHNLRTANKVLSPHLRRLAESRQVEDLDRLRASADIWLTPAIMKGFDPADFTFLTPEKRTVLAAKVDEYRELASRLVGGVPSVEELLGALQLLTEIMDPLTDYVSDSEGMAILLALWSFKESIPSFVLGIDYTTDTDATGDPAIWIWVVIDDEIDPESEEFKKFVREFPPRVRKALQKVKSDRIPYVHFRLRSEVKEAIAGGAA